MQELNLDSFFQEDIIEKSKTQIKNEYYNYIYLDPRKAGRYCYEGLNFSLLYEPFYVGKGTGNRYKVHMLEKKTSNPEKIKYINELKTSKNDPIILILNVTEDEKLSYVTESNIINNIKCTFNGGTLTNKISHYPLNCTEELRKSFGSPKEKHPLWKKGHSEESKKKISENHHDCSGANNGRAKKYKIINDLGQVYDIHGTLCSFCESVNIDWSSLYRYINKGKILKYRNRSDSTRTSLLGWEIRRVD